MNPNRLQQIKSFILHGDYEWKIVNQWLAEKEGEININKMYATPIKSDARGNMIVFWIWYEELYEN